MSAPRPPSQCPKWPDSPPTASWHSRKPSPHRNDCSISIKQGRLWLLCRICCLRMSVSSHLCVRTCGGLQYKPSTCKTDARLRAVTFSSFGKRRFTRKFRSPRTCICTPSQYARMRAPKTEIAGRQRREERARRRVPHECPITPLLWVPSQHTTWGSRRTVSNDSKRLCTLQRPLQRLQDSHRSSLQTSVVDKCEYVCIHLHVHHFFLLQNRLY